MQRTSTSGKSEEVPILFMVGESWVWRVFLPDGKVKEWPATDEEIARAMANAEAAAAELPLIDGKEPPRW